MNEPVTPPSSSLLHEQVPERYRRLSDKVLVVFHMACDAGDYDAARRLLGVLEAMMTRGPVPGAPNRRQDFTGLVNANERLWALENPGAVAKPHGTDIAI